MFITALVTISIFLSGCLVFSIAAPRHALETSNWPFIALGSLLVLILTTAVWQVTSIDLETFRLAYFSLIALGVVRIYLHYRSVGFVQNVAALPFMFTLIIFFPTAIELIQSSFDINDEIYSWNYWAKQFFLREQIDFYFTQAPYPQGFSRLITGFYLIAGNFDYQSAAKFLLWSLPIIFLTLILSFYRESRYWVYLLLVIIITLGLDFDKLYSSGLADPFMATLLGVGVLLLLKIDDHGTKKQQFQLIFSCILITAAALTKQAALLWSCLFYPLMFIAVVRKYRISYKWLPLSIIPLISSLIWLLTFGSDFHNNNGVLSASMADRGFIEQIYFAVLKYIFELPLLFPLIGFFFYQALRQHDSLALIGCIGCAVSIIFWLIFGSYDIRLGMHFILILWALAASSTQEKNAIKTLSISIKNWSILLSILAMLSLGYSYKTNLKHKKSYNYNGQTINQKFGYERQVNKILGQGTLTYLNNLTSHDTNIWVGSNYIYGIFYGKVLTNKPEIESADIDTYFDQQNISHVFLSSEAIAFGSANEIVREHVTQNPDCYNKVILTNRTYSEIVIYERRCQTDF